MHSRPVKGAHLLLPRNRVFKLRNVQIWVVSSCKGVDLLMLRNRVYRLRNVKKCVVPSFKGSNYKCSGIAFSGCGMFRYGQCRPA